jgi:hypothetical protein
MRICTQTKTKGLFALAIAGLCIVGSQSQGKIPSSNSGPAVTPNVPGDIPFEDGGIAGTSNCNYGWDDGLGETSIGFTGGAATNWVWATRFIANPGCNEITSVQVAFGTAPAGTPVQVYVMSDPNSDGIPNDAVVLSTANGISANENTDTYNNYPVPSAFVSGSFFVAVRMNQPPGNFPARLDQTATNGQIWLTRGFTNNANPFTDPDAITENQLDDPDPLFHGDWMIRAAGNGNQCGQPLKPCSGDVHPPASGNNNVVAIAGNGVVNVEDLLHVISVWGQNGNPNGPRPTGDTAPPPNGNCLVDVTDLLGAIGQWGACPTPPPVNDNCTTPIPAVGLNVWNNANATTDASVDGCDGDSTKEVWFSYVAPTTGALVVSTEGSIGNIDTTLSIYTAGCAGTGSPVACDDNSGTGFLSRVSYGVVQGQPLLIRVASAGAYSGSGQLFVATTNNDTCANASEVAVGGSVNSSLVGATQDLGEDCNGVSFGQGRWHTVVGTGGELTASLCGSPGNINDIWNARLSVFCGTGCADFFTCVTASDAENCNSNPNLLFAEELSWCSTLGQTYWILVHAPVTPTTVGYTLAVGDAGSCTSKLVSCSPIPPPPNDECSGAIEIPAGAAGTPTQFTANNAGATPSAPAGPTCAGGGATNAGPDVWYTYTAPATGVLFVKTCDTVVIDDTVQVSDTVLGVYTGNCAELGTEYCDEDGCPLAKDIFNSQLLTPVPVTLGQEVLIRVSSYVGSPVGEIIITTNTIAAVCGNGIIEVGEQCDGGPHCTGCLYDDLSLIPDEDVVLEAEACAGDGACDNTNGAAGTASSCVVGCNYGPNVTVGTIYRGQCSTFLNVTDKHDADHWQFVAPSDGVYLLIINANFAGGGNFMTHAASTGCGAIAFIVGTAAWVNNTNYAVPISLVPFLTTENHAIRIRPGVVTGLTCAAGPHEYTFVVVGPVPQP